MIFMFYDKIWKWCESFSQAEIWNHKFYNTNVNKMSENKLPKLDHVTTMSLLNSVNSGMVSYEFGQMVASSAT